MVLWWRALYAAIGRRWFVALCRAAVAVADLIKPGAALTLLETRVGESWPRRVPGWINVHVSRLLWRLRRPSMSSTSPNAGRRAASAARLRIGCLGSFSGLLGFPPWLFAAFPASADLFVYDLQYKGALAPTLAQYAREYRPFDLETANDYDQTIRTLAAAIDGDELDLLLVIRFKRDVYDVLDRVTTPCIAHVCTGSDVLHHPRVDFNLFCQPEADFFPVDHALFCGYTHTPVDNVVVYPATLCFDPRDLDLTAPAPSWRERQPLIVFHGSLYKLAAAQFLDCLFDVMKDVDDVEFAFMGKDWHGALRQIQDQARAAGVASRVHYEGTFSAMRDASGQVRDAGWLRLLDLLKQARLAPNPWPLGGASARFEAYVMGTPTVHMGLRTDRESWGREQLTVCEVPNLLVPETTAYSIDDYKRIATACLQDETFADNVARAQRRQALRASDRTAYWQQVLDAHEEWRRPHVPDMVRTA